MTIAYLDTIQDKVCSHGKDLVSVPYRSQNRSCTTSQEHHRLSCSQLRNRDAQANCP